jgi:AhpD family alkylhydroperoxidase
MTDVTVTNRRADSSANEDLTKLARHGADAFGYKANLRIDRKLAQLLRLRVSQINNCTYCTSRRARRALLAGGDPRDHRDRHQHECLDPTQAGRGRHPGPAEQAIS